MMKRLIPFIFPLLCSTSFTYADVMQADIKAQKIENFKVGSDQKRFGKLEFLGGLELSSEHELFGAMSAIRLSDDRKNFLAVADTGHWFKGSINRDAEGLASGLSSFEIAPILDKNGNQSPQKWLTDAEALVVKGDYVFVAFERNSRIDGFDLKNPLQSPAIASLPVQIPLNEFRQNGGLEAMAKSPDDSALKGAIVAFSERSVNKNGDLFSAIVDGPESGVFFVKRHPPYNITDADFLPNGDVLLLERRFNIAAGIGMRIRKIDADSIKKGATVNGDVLIDVGAGHQIDNMEGLSISTDGEGNVLLTIVSDDNHSFLQRNLLLEFKLLEQ